MKQEPTPPKGSALGIVKQNLTIQLSNNLTLSTFLKRITKGTLARKNSNIFGFSLTYWIKSSHSNKQIHLFASRLIRFFVPLPAECDKGIHEAYISI